MSEKRTLPAPLIAILLVLLLTLLVFQQRQAPARSVAAVASRPDSSLLGLDLAARFGPMTALTGDVPELRTDGLRLWVIVDDEECLSCLLGIPILAERFARLTGLKEHAAVVASGDRHEARRTFYGSEPGMPVYVTGSGAIERLAARGTPLRLLTWEGRIIAEWPEEAALLLAEEGGSGH